MHPSKRKGNRFERELVDEARRAGIKAERARGSDGRALGEAQTVDLLLSGLRVQAKRRRALAGYMKPPEGCDLTVIREDHAEALAVVPFKLLLKLIQQARHAAPPAPKNKGQLSMDLYRPPGVM